MFILKGKLLHYTKEIIKPLQIILLSILFLTLIIFIKYKPVYSVTLSGETLGYVAAKSDFESELNEYINNTEDNNIVSINIDVMPEYELELALRSEETSEEEILEIIEETAVITYETYGITVNGEVELEVSSESEALEIIDNLTTDLQEEVDFDVAYTSVYKTELESTSKEEAITVLTEIKTEKVTEYEEEQAKIAEEEAAAEEAKLASASTGYTSVSSGSYGSINGITITTPLKGSALITSRYGEVSSSRSSTHTGLDLATSLGTQIYPIAEGTVTSASYQGSYGNLIIIDHGSGVESYYAHCNTINVSVGEAVTLDTVIGTVGSTGNSTGPHLHLEIRINGTAVNPQNYLY